MLSQQRTAFRFFLGLSMAAVLAVAAVMLLPHSQPAVLSESAALELAEGKESQATRETIARGGSNRPTALYGYRKSYRHAMDTLHNWAQQERSLRDSRQSPEEEASTGIKVKGLSRAAGARGGRTSLAYFINSNGQRASNLDGGDTAVPVSYIKEEDEGRPAPVLSEGHQQMALRSMGAQGAVQQSKKQRSAIRAFLNANGDARTAARAVAQGHVGDELLTGGDSRPMSQRASTKAAQDGTAELMASILGRSRYRRDRHSLSRDGVNTNEMPMQNKQGQVF